MSFTMAGAHFLKDSVRPQFRSMLFFVIVVSILIASGFTIMFGVKIRREVPKNYLLLGVFTFAEASSFASLTSKLDP